MANREGARNRANVVYLDDPTARLKSTEPAPDLHIRVDWDRRIPEVRFYPVTAGQQEEWRSEGPGYHEAVKFAHYLESHLGKIASGFRRPSAWASVRHRLKALGWRAAHRILPIKLVEYVHDNLEPGQTLTISTNECWIPWELIFDVRHNEFWGEMFVLHRRQTRDVRPQHPPQVMLQSKPISPRGKRIVSVVGDRTGSARLAPSLWKKFLPDLDSLDSNEPGRNQFFTVARVVAAIESGAEIIHLTCHGEVDHGGERYLRLGPQASEHFLYAFDVMPVDISGGLLFLNACSAVAPHEGGAGPWLGLTTFGWLVELRRKGAVIGTYAPISAIAANEVATRFYQHFLMERLTAGESLYQAKQSLRLEGKPFGLVYSLYGDPNLRMSPSPSTESK